MPGASFFPTVAKKFARTQANDHGRSDIAEGRSLSLAISTKLHLTRKALLRHAVNNGKPETKLMVDVIVQAVSDSMKKQHSGSHTKGDKLEACRFFDDGRMAQVCDLVGLNYEYAQEVVKKIREV